MKPALSIIIPLRNEAENLSELYQRLCEVCKTLSVAVEFIFVDDGSTDASPVLLRKMNRQDQRVRYIRFTRNFGHQIALFAGLEHATGERIVFMDADLQDPPECLTAFWEKMNQGADMVYGKRTRRAGESWFKRITAALFYRLLNRLTRFHIPSDTGDFRMITQEVAHDLRQMRDRTKFLRGELSWLGYAEAVVHYDRPARKKGKTGFGLSSMIRLALDGITAFSDTPLRLVSALGLFMSVFSFGMIVYVLLAKWVWQQTISGWASLMVTILFLGGIQLLSIGIIGEYISRINDAVRQRPLYVIAETENDSAADQP